jgi:predicted NBD/HSP70 family sugar kinase
MTEVAAIGIDVGGTKIAVGALRPDGSRVELRVTPTARFNGDANLAAVVSAAETFATPDTPIGISLATTIDEHGIVRDPRGWFGWTGVDLPEALRSLSNPVTIAPDAACGAVAEARWGAGVDARRVLYVTLGTGISHAVVTEGVADVGSHGAGILSGSIPPFRSSWPTDGSWLGVEDVASGPAIAAAFAGSPAATDAHPLADAYRSGDWWARRVVEHASWQLGSLIAGMATATDPDRIVLGGGLAAGFPEYAALAEEVAAVALHDWHHPLVPLARARFGGESCWIGAAALAAGAAPSPDRKEAVNV